MERTLRNLVIVLGDQLDLEASGFDGFDPLRDAVWMAEVAEDSTHVAANPRMALQVRNVDRIDDDERAAIGRRAAAIRRGEVVANA
jgi:deoxyribodipyrimidine photolyase-related protein